MTRPFLRVPSTPCGRASRLMNAKSDKTLSEIEGNQTALRKSIEVTRTLSAQIDRLLKRHRKELDEGN